MKNLWTKTQFCEMKVKKNSQKMDERFTREDFWKMAKLFALILFLTIMGFLNASSQFDRWEVLDNPYDTNRVIVLIKSGDENRAYSHMDYWQVLSNTEQTNDIIILYRSGRSCPDSWECPKPSCRHINYYDFLNCGICGTYRYDKF